MTTFALVVFFSLQATLLILDLWESRRQAHQQQHAVRLGTVGFLVAVVCIYLCLQLGGARLLPSPAELLASVRQFSLQWSGDDGTSSMSPWTALLLSVGIFYTAGFWDYLVHRCFSHSRWFWVTHEYHHLPRQVTVWMPGILVRPFGFVPVTLSTLATAATIYIGLTAFHLPSWDLQPLLPVVLFIILVLTASHSAFLRRRWTVHRVMRVLGLTTPQEHLLHHGVDSQCNYGNFTTLWDRLLGTYQNPELVDLEAFPLGLSYDQDFLGAITLSRLRLSTAQRQKFQVDRYCNVEDNSDGP